MGGHDIYKVGGLGTGKVGGHAKSQGRGIRDWKCGRTLGSSKVQRHSRVGSEIVDSNGDRPINLDGRINVD